MAVLLWRVASSQHIGEITYPSLCEVLQSALHFFRIRHGGIQFYHFEDCETTGSLCQYNWQRQASHFNFSEIWVRFLKKFKLQLSFLHVYLSVKWAAILCMEECRAWSPCTGWLMAGAWRMFLFLKAAIQCLLVQWEMKAECFLPLVLSRNLCCHVTSRIQERNFTSAVRACEYLKISYYSDFVCGVALYLVACRAKQQCKKKNTKKKKM